MCGRFVLHTPMSTIARRYWNQQKPIGDRVSNYNITPGQQIHSVRLQEGKPVFDLAFWGFRPKWARENAPTPINARAEKLSAAYFRAAFKSGRCVIPANGWYEWQETAQGKQPYYITRQGQEPGDCLFFAGLTTPTGEGTAHRVAIITEPAGQGIDQLHDRQPVLLDPASLSTWLDLETDPDQLKGQIERVPATDLTWWPISTSVNRPANNGAGLIEPLHEAVTGQ